MTQKMLGVIALVLISGVVAAGCNREQPVEESGAASQAPLQGDLDIAFRSDPEPPATGENTFEVTVKQPDGTPVTDATVTAEFFMPAMPTMNMPEMRNSTPLTHEGGGTYRGKGQVMMAGSWDVTVNVARGGETLGSRKLSVTAK